MSASENCSFCGNEVPSPSQHCPHCGQPGRFWNVLAANEPDERAALDRRYQSAKQNAALRSADKVLQDFENVVVDSKAVISRYYSEVLRLAGSTRQLYGSYYQLRDAGIRLPDGNEWDMFRELADTLLFAGYKEHIKFGALTLEDRGLPNWGDCAMVLRDKMIAHRTSIFEENSALFVERHGIKISRRSSLPKGYRANWTDRARLAVAKLYSRIDSTITRDKYSELLLTPGSASEDDDFVEAHIFGPMTVLTVEKVTVLAPRASKRATILRAIKSKLAKHKVPVN
jgi:hypothetical protein